MTLPAWQEAGFTLGHGLYTGTCPAANVPFGNVKCQARVAWPFLYAPEG